MNCLLLLLLLFLLLLPFSSSITIYEKQMSPLPKKKKKLSWNPSNISSLTHRFCCCQWLLYTHTHTLSLQMTPAFFASATLRLAQTAEGNLGCFSVCDTRCNQQGGALLQTVHKVMLQRLHPPSPYARETENSYSLGSQNLWFSICFTLEQTDFGINGQTEWK